MDAVHDAARPTTLELEQVQRRARVAVGVQRDRLQRVRLDVEPASTPSPRSASVSARCRMASTSSVVRPRSTNTFDRDSSAALTSNDGFSVVAPMSTMSPALDARQERVLLRLVEAVDLVDEDDRAPAGRSRGSLGVGHHVLDLLDAGEHGAERHEPRLRRVGDDARERRLAGARRSPEDDRLQQVALDGLAQRPARREQILLADELVERARPHPLGERRVCRGRRRRIVREQAVHGRWARVRR